MVVVARVILSGKARPILVQIPSPQNKPAATPHKHVNALVAMSFVVE